MLSPTVPTGPRNPNGYTGDEVLRAIRGIDGTREVSFRYELLDRDLKHRYDLDNILGGSVQLQYISEIKRTASFNMQGGAGINWLDDHVKPYFRLRMPPKMISDGVPVNVFWENSFDAVSGDVTPENSGDHGDNLSSVADEVRYSDDWSAAGVGSCLLGSDDGSTAGRITFNFRSRTSWKFIFYVNIPTGSNLNFLPDGLDNNSENYIQFDDSFGVYRLGSVDINQIKDNLFGQPFRVEVLNDGHRCTYNLHWTDPDGDDPDFTVSENSSFWEPIQTVNVSGGGFTRDPSHIDEIQSSVIGDTEYIARSESIWSNSFDGASGDDVSVDELRFYGSIPDIVSGDVSFNEDWSTAGSSSLMLGGTEGSGSMQVSVPSQDEWSLRMYANIPSGGKLFVCPSSEESIPSPDESPEWPGPIEKIGTRGSTGWNTTISAPVPEGTVQGDYIVAVVTTNDGAEPDEQPDWDLLDSQEFGEDTWIFVYGHDVGADEPSSHSFTFGQDHYHALILQSWRNTNGVRFVGINAEDEATSVSLPSLSSEEDDALAAVGFDWLEVLKTWDDSGALDLDLHQSRGMIVSSLLELPGGSTPTYPLITDGSDPSRMAAVSIVMHRIPNPLESPDYPGPIQRVGAEENNDFDDFVTVNVPASVQEDDLMLATVSANDFDDVTPPAGWGLVTSLELGSGTSYFLYDRIASDSEPADYTWNFDGSHWHSAVISAWRNTPGIRNFAIDGDEGITSVDSESLEALSGDALVLAGFDWAVVTKSWNDGGELTEEVNVDNHSQIVSSLLDLPEGLTDVFSMTTSSGTGSRMSAITVVLESYPEPDEDTLPFRGPNWIVLDDEAGEYTIAGRSVGLYQDQLIGTPVRIEMETYGGSFWWQVFSTDPDGDAPDLNWFGDASDWGSLRACLFQGGGDGIAGTPVDEVRFGRIVPVNRPTPENQNFVEFPLGVFLLSSPTRHIDADDVIIRDVESYDRTKLFVDDKLTERFTVTKGEVYTDILDSLVGDIPKIIEPSDAVCGRDREWQVGTKIKSVIDSIAESINYHTLRFDEEGKAVLRPYVSPDDRAPEFDYADNEVSIMYPDVEVEFDTFDIANVWITSVSEVDEDPIFVKLENQDPSNPFSIPRRGRRIVDFRQEEEATDRESLMRKAKRIQFEANREYENVSFQTLMNPLHSANDCYTIDFGSLNVKEKYTEINWEFGLEAGSNMTHTARRVVKLDEEESEGFVEDHLQVNGALTVGNINWGVVTLPINRTDTPQVVTVTGLDLKGTGRVDVLVTAETVSPQNFKQVCSQKETPTGFEVWGYRTTSFNTNIHWLALRNL